MGQIENNKEKARGGKVRRGMVRRGKPPLSESKQAPLSLFILCNFSYGLTSILFHESAVI